jgi:hypothetical protein
LILGWSDRVTVYENDSDLMISNAPILIAGAVTLVQKNTPADSYLLPGLSALDAVFLFGTLVAMLFVSWSLATAVSANRSLLVGLMVGLLKLMIMPLSFLCSALSTIDTRVKADAQNDAVGPPQISPPQTSAPKNAASKTQKADNYSEGSERQALVLVYIASWVIKTLVNGSRVALLRV